MLKKQAEKNSSKNTTNRIQIIEFTLSMLNEQLASKLGTHVSIVSCSGNDERHVLRVDASRFAADYRRRPPPSTHSTHGAESGEHAADLDAHLNAVVHLKYTNESGMQHNQCHSVRFQLEIRLVHSVHLDLLDIVDLK